MQYINSLYRISSVMSVQKCKVLQSSKRFKHSLTFVTVLYSKCSLGGFVVSHVAQSFTFPCGLILDDHAILNITIFLRETQTDRGNSPGIEGFIFTLLHSYIMRQEIAVIASIQGFMFIYKFYFIHMLGFKAEINTK